MKLLEKLVLVSSILAIISFVIVTPLVSSSKYNVAHAQAGEIPIDKACDPTSDPDPDCYPPTLQSGEFIAVRAMFFIWAFAGILWTVFLIRVGMMYYLSYGQPDKISEAHGQGVRWGIGFFILFIGRALVATIMGELVDAGPGCYEKLDDPGFTFFFSEVCTDGDPAP